MMSRGKRVVVGLDGSDESRSALRWAVAEAAVWDAQLDVVHAWDFPFVIVPPPMNLTHPADVEALERSAGALLDAEVEAARAHSGRSPRHVEKILVRDTASRALLDTAKGADLLVVGSRGRGGFGGLLLGSVSNQCVHHGPCPVAVVRETLDSSRRTRIVVGVDGSACGQEALTWAIAEAAATQQPLVALAAWSWLDQPGEFDPDFGEKDVKAMAEAAVAKALDEVAAGNDVDIEVRTVNDHPGPALIDASSEASLLVVGSRGLGGFRGLLLGSVSNNAVHHAHCPVVVVRH
jgi:nucleotide-binding universal stress UspA family protein